jgi:excinuclease UvrABC ATPase subunit
MLILDGGAVGVTPDGVPGARVFTPASCYMAHFSEKQASSSFGLIVVTDVVAGPLNIGRLELPIGVPTLLTGPTGSGKSLLLRDVFYGRFSRRRKLASIAAFGALSVCTLIEVSQAEQCGTLLELLGLEGLLAKVVIATREAKRFGLGESDFDPSQSRYRCRACGAEDRCPECGGALFEPLVSELPLAGRTFGELLTLSLPELVRALWTEEAFSIACEAVPEKHRSRLSLGASPLQLEPAVRRYVYLAARLALAGSAPVRRSAKKAPARNERLDDKLLLVDGPLGFTDQDQVSMVNTLQDLSQRGATIVISETVPAQPSAARPAEALRELCFFRKIVRLEVQAGCLLEARMSTADFTRRISRWSRVAETSE